MKDQQNSKKGTRERPGPIDHTLPLVEIWKTSWARRYTTDLELKALWGFGREEGLQKRTVCGGAAKLESDKGKKVQSRNSIDNAVGRVRPR